MILIIIIILFFIIIVIIMIMNIMIIIYDLSCPFSTQPELFGLLGTQDEYV